jgi:diaminopimelate epimerase
MRFHKYHALGNDYIVLDPADFPSWGTAPTREQIRVVCHRNFGVGSDGILWGPAALDPKRARLRIFNPDGSEAEKSGNGLRIFSRFLWDQGSGQKVSRSKPPAGTCVRHQGGRPAHHRRHGPVSFDSARFP